MTPVNPEANVAHARRVAADLTKRFAITSPEDLLLEDIAMVLGAFVVEDHLEGAEGRLIRKGHRGIIRIRADIPEVGRKRFAIAHEIGHWELHADILPWAICSEDDMLDYKNSPLEIEANIFASELLMPTMLFRPRCQDAEPSLQLVKTLASEFNTTLTATAVRLAEECRENCVVIFSQNGEVRWWRKKDRWSGLWIEPHQTIHRDSSAWQCLKDNTSPLDQMEQVPTEAWFPSRQSGPKITVYEQSMKLGRYPTILSLLWVIECDDEEEDGDSRWSTRIK